MPTISRFYGIIINMYWGDHAPPHFHALYGDYEVVVSIANLEVSEGTMPRRALAFVLEWAQIHQAELMENWVKCQARRHPDKITPLE